MRYGGKYGLVELMERYGDVQLPTGEIIDTKKIEQKDRSKVMLSPPLVEAMQEVLNREQTGDTYFKTEEAIRLTRFVMYADGCPSVNTVMYR